MPRFLFIPVNIVNNGMSVSCYYLPTLSNEILATATSETESFLPRDLAAKDL